MSDNVDAKLAETKILLQKLLNESEKVVNPEPEAFGRHLKSLLVEGESLRKLLVARGTTGERGEAKTSEAS